MSSAIADAARSAINGVEKTEPTVNLNEWVSFAKENESIQYLILFLSVVVALYFIKPSFVMNKTPYSEKDNPDYQNTHSVKAILIVSIFVVAFAISIPYVIKNKNEIKTMCTNVYKWIKKQ